MRISILEGAYFDANGNIRSSLPVNMRPVLTESGLSKGYLRTEPGLTLAVSLGAQDRGAIVWRGAQYRVIGSQLYWFPTGPAQALGNVGNDGLPVRFDIGFDRIVIYSAGNVYYWNGLTMTQVQNPNIGNGPPIDVCWIDGYYMLTDGTNLYVTSLADPTQLLPNAYEQPPEDPSPIVAVMRVRDEIYACTQNSIQNFQNVGGINFPFQVNPSGLIPKGPVGTHAVCYFNATLAFVGSGRTNEAVSVYVAGFGVATPISTPEIDRLLGQLTPAQLTALEIESLVSNDEQHLYVHLPTCSLVYHLNASQAAGQPIWTKVAGGPNMDQAYPARHFVFINGAPGGQIFGGSSTGQICLLDETVQTQIGQPTTWQFDTLLQYNEGRGAILKSAELVGTATPGTALLSWTRDGLNWSAQQSIAIGSSTTTPKRMQWRPKTRMWNFMGLRFQGKSSAVATFATLNADLEPLDA